MQDRDVSVMMEPGRFICAPATTLHTRILAVYDRNVILNGSVYNCFLDSILVVPLRLLVRGEGSSGQSYVLKGCTPDSLDIFRYDVYFDSAPVVGDEVVFESAGAYNFSTDFFHLPKPQTRIVP